VARVANPEGRCEQQGNTFCWAVAGRTCGLRQSPAKRPMRVISHPQGMNMSVKHHLPFLTCCGCLYIQFRDGHDGVIECRSARTVRQRTAGQHKLRPGGLQCCSHFTSVTQAMGEGRGIDKADERLCTEGRAVCAVCCECRASSTERFFTGKQSWWQQCH